MQQNTGQWLNWRTMGIGASDVPIIMGVSKYKTPFELWEIKTRRKKNNDKPSFVAELGHKFESMARAEFELYNDMGCPPICVEHADHPFLRASLDGCNVERGIFLEIKYVGQDRLDWVKQNQRALPDHESQIDHQFFVTGFNTCFYICYTLTSDRKMIDEIVTVKLIPNVARIQVEVMPKVFEFWDLVQKDIPPPLTKKDVRRAERLSGAGNQRNKNK